ncbi:MAG: DUF5719 family protein [Acidimicrobiia bacterium]
MTRIILAIAVVAALVGGWVVAPLPTVGVDTPGLEPAAAAAALCPVRIDRTVDGKLTVGSTLASPARVTVGNAGAVATDQIVEVGDAGGAAVDFDDLIAGGTAGAFVEFGVTTAAAATVSRGDAGVAAVACPSLLRTTSVITGASTRNGESLELILVNPYGADAVVAVESSSEIGADSAEELASVVVPARSTVTRDLATLLPLRNRLSLAITPIRGLVHAFVEGGGRGDRVLIEHVDPASEWISPIPRVDGLAATLVVSSVSPVDVAMRVDGWSDGVFVEGVHNEVIPPRGQIEIPLAVIDVPLQIARILADGPIGVSLVLEGDAGRAATPVNREAVPEWLMPGPGSAGSIAWIGVDGDSDAVVEFLSLDDNGESFTMTAAAGSVTPVPLDDQLIGYSLRADSPVTVLWSVSDDTGIGLGAPTPLPGGE